MWVDVMGTCGYRYGLGVSSPGATHTCTPGLVGYHHKFSSNKVEVYEGLAYQIQNGNILGQNQNYIVSIQYPKKYIPD
jgi:hypothetical protein